MKLLLPPLLALTLLSQVFNWDPVCSSLVQLRAKLPTPPPTAALADLLNEVAYKHPGWMLSYKKTGSFCTRFDGTPIACDILIGPDMNLYDVIGDAGGASTIYCPAGAVGVPSAERPAISPIKPQGKPDECPACPECKPCKECADVTALAVEIAALRTLVEAQAAAIERLEQRPFPNYVGGILGFKVILRPEK